MNFAIALFIAIVLPAIAWADGGHPVVVDAHALAHLVYFGLPIAVVGIVTLAVRKAKAALTR